MLIKEIDEEALKNSFDKVFKSGCYTPQQVENMKCLILGPKEASHLDPGCVIKNENGKKIGRGKSKFALLFPREWNQNWSRGDGRGVEKEYLLVYLYYHYFEHTESSIFPQMVRPKQSEYRFRGGRQSAGYKVLQKNYKKIHRKIIEIIENDKTSFYKHDENFYKISEKICEFLLTIDKNLNSSFFEIDVRIDKSYTGRRIIENINEESNIIYTIYEKSNTIYTKGKKMNKNQFQKRNKIKKTGLSLYIAYFVIKDVCTKCYNAKLIHEIVTKNPKYKDVSIKSVQDAINSKTCKEVLLRRGRKYFRRTQKINAYRKNEVKNPNPSICKIIKEQELSNSLIAISEKELIVNKESMNEIKELRNEIKELINEIKELINENKELVDEKIQERLQNMRVIF